MKEIEKKENEEMELLVVLLGTFLYFVYFALLV